jgi:hypothetical protein
MEVKTFEFLNGFEKRMQLAAAVDSIINRRNKNMEIEKVFLPGQMENLILSALVFIMDKTLSEEEECTLENIGSFLASIVPNYLDNHEDVDAKTLAEYIIKDILQNGGEARYFPIIKYGEGFKQYRVKLIDDKIKELDKGYKVIYQLSDQGYDFLFRTKEVEEEINFTIEELKLRELIKRKNYKKAITQSKSLVQMIRQKKKDVLGFIQRIKENIYEVDIGEFESLVKSTYDLLAEEYGIMNEIKEMITLSQQRLKEEEDKHGILDEDMKKAKSEISTIIRNIHTTINEQQDLILQRHSLSRIYIETIGDSFVQTVQRRFDLGKVIIEPLERMSQENADNLWKLFNPIFKPTLPKYLNVLSMFERQSKIKMEEGPIEGIKLETLSEDKEKAKVKRLNEVNVEVVERLLSYSHQGNLEFRFSEFFEYLKENSKLFEALLHDNSLFNALLRLYEMGEIDLDAWSLEGQDVAENVTGEFDIAYCLCKVKNVRSDMYGVKGIFVKNIDDITFKLKVEAKKEDIAEAIFSQCIEITDFVIEVKK